MINDNLDEFNFHKLKNTLNINNFVNTFTFYEENNLIGKKSYYENNFSYKIDENNSLSFKTRENKTDNLTEYYNLIYEYKNDCLTASIRYNKEYYSSSTAKPNEELFFNITLVPLGSTQTESILE
jgi:LPS-assembly protein